MPDTESQADTLTTRTIGHYLESLGSSAPTPGGGSAAGLVGALAASLGLMVISLTSTEDTEAKQHLGAANTALEELQARFTRLAERDESVYQSYRNAAALPKVSPEEKAERRAEMQRALKNAATVPLEACEAAVELGKALIVVQQYGNPYLLSDARIAVLCTSTCFESSRINVNVNLAMIKDDAWITDTANRVDFLAEELQRHLHNT